MRARSLALSFGFAFSALAAQPASAQDGRGATCFIRDPQSNLYLTDAIPVNIPRNNPKDWIPLSNAIAADLARFVNEKYGLSLGTDGTVGCHILPSMEDAQRSIDRQPDVRPNGAKNIKTGWSTKTARLTAAPASKPVASGGYLTIEDNGRANQQRVQSDAILKAQQQEAAVLAKRTADTAREQARTQAKLKKLLEDLRKRGRTQ